MKTKMSTWPLGAAMLGVMSLIPVLWGGEIPEISKPAAKTSTDYPETIGGAPFSEGFSDDSPSVSCQTHGWKLPAPGGLYPLVRITEILRAPAPSTFRTWRPDVILSIASDRRSCTTMWSQFPEDGWIEGSWQFEPCDPKGWYSFEIYFDGRLVDTIPFEVK